MTVDYRNLKEPHVVPKLYTFLGGSYVSSWGAKRVVEPFFENLF